MLIFSIFCKCCQNDNIFNFSKKIVKMATFSIFEKNFAKTDNKNNVTKMATKIIAKMTRKNVIKENGKKMCCQTK